MADIFNQNSTGLDSPGLFHYAVTPHDSTDFPISFRSLWVGGAGNVVIVANDGTAVTYVGAAAGSVIPMRGKRVNATGTTATSLVGIY